MRRTKHDWRRAVLRDPSLRDSTRVLLLHIADNHMRADRKFSVPRSQLADEMNRAERRIDERFRDAVTKQFLIPVSAGYRGHTAEYQGVWPGESATDTSTHKRATDSSALSAGESATYGGRTTSKRHLTAVGLHNVRIDARTRDRWRLVVGSPLSEAA